MNYKDALVLIYIQSLDNRPDNKNYTVVHLCRKTGQFYLAVVIYLQALEKKEQRKKFGDT